MLRGALRGHPSLAVESRIDLGCPGSSGSLGHGGGVGRDDLLAGQAGVPQQPPQVIIDRDVESDTPVERLPEQPWLLKHLCSS